jgi:hypothetical protein
MKGPKVLSWNEIFNIKKPLFRNFYFKSILSIKIHFENKRKAVEQKHFTLIPSDFGNFLVKNREKGDFSGFSLKCQNPCFGLFWHFFALGTTQNGLLAKNGAFLPYGSMAHRGHLDIRLAQPTFGPINWTFGQKWGSLRKNLRNHSGKIGIRLARPNYFAIKIQNK